MATKNNPGNYDCYESAAPDEPMFVLLGRDRHGAAVVRHWIALREAEGDTIPSKIDEAKTCADAMERFADERMARQALVDLGWQWEDFERHVKRCSDTCLRRVLELLAQDSGDERMEMLSRAAEKLIVERLGRVVPQ